MRFAFALLIFLVSCASNNVPSTPQLISLEVNSSEVICSIDDMASMPDWADVRSEFRARYDGELVEETFTKDPDYGYIYRYKYILSLGPDESDVLALAIVWFPDSGIRQIQTQVLLR